MSHLLKCTGGWVLALVLCLSAAAPAAAAEPVVQAVLFYSPSCPHCHYVVNEVLPPLFEQYGDQLQLAGVNVSEPDGQALYQEAVEVFDIADDRIGVPTLIAGEMVLVGSREIETQLPGLIESYLAQGGLAWPNLPSLLEALAQAGMAGPAATAAAPAVPDEAGALLGSGVLARLARDPVGNGLAIVLLCGMLVVAAQAGSSWLRPHGPGLPRHLWRGWAPPGMVAAGLAIAGYLTYVEATQTLAVCGPVGDCNAVQQSQYARLLGVPMGALGLAGYAAMLLSWLAARLAQGRWADRALAALAAMAFAGTLFSIYLTFLEPFVIGAACAWCLASAALMTGLLWLTAAPGREALARLLGLGQRARPGRQASA